MPRIEERLAELGLVLPEPFRSPSGDPFKFAPVRVAGDVAYISGHGPMDGARPLASGKIGKSTWRTGKLLTLEQGRWAARATALSVLASLKNKLGDLDAVSGWVKVLGFVNCSPGFTQTVAVIDGFTELIVELWGGEGVHARSAIGVAELPFNIPVEVEAVVALAPASRSSV
jgi:enamine deaminase RidA (YjgF/YER057c/UK114 family)